MKWQGRGGSGNVEDRRGMGMRHGWACRVGGGIGGIVLLLLLSALTGTNPLDLIGGVERTLADGSRPGRAARQRPAVASSSAWC